MKLKKVPEAISRLLLKICLNVFPEARAIKQFWHKFGKLPNLMFPKTFNEKIMRGKCFNRNPKLRLFADKLLVRDFVKSKLGNGEQYLTRLYAVIERADRISSLQLPDRFVMKSNHASGHIKIVFDFSEIKFGELEKLAEMWLGVNYFDVSYEWQYKKIKPRIMFEELLGTEGKVPDDYKFFCFHGKANFVAIDRNRFLNHQRNMYDMNFSLLPVKYPFENFMEDLSAPKNFKEMIEISEKLSQGIDFLRVDLYNIEGRIVFGELTSSPGAGLDPFEPALWDKKIGDYW